MKNNRFEVWCVIPVYNNANTIVQIIEDVKTYIIDVLVVDDGSTDCDLEKITKSLGITYIRHEKNLGKGAAILTALKYLKEINVDYAICIDADGQHYPSDIPKFLEKIENESTIIVGERDFETTGIPSSSRFGRLFSNFWTRIETGISVADTQCGFRAYPVNFINKLNFRFKKYNFESEVLAKGAWAGLKIINLPINVWYPKVGESRVSNFKPVLDNLRFAITHTYLMILRILPIPQKKLIISDNSLYKEVIYSILHPIQLLKYLLKEHATPFELSIAAGLGTLLAILPIPGLHSVAIIYFSTRFHLNRLMAFSIQHIFMPPVTPFICIQLGYFLIHGHFLTKFTLNVWIVNLPSRVFDWLIGSIILAPVMMIIMAFIVYLVSKTMKFAVKKNKL